MIIRPFNAAHLLLLALAAGAVVLLWVLLRGQPERCRSAVLIALCAANIIGFFVYKGFLSRDMQFLQASGLDRFNWFSELPMQLCNINMFLIPIGILTKRRSLLGFAFFVAPLAALMALVFPEAPFVGYSLWLPRMLGFYATHILIIVCGLSLVTLGFYRPQFRDIPGIAGTFFPAWHRCAGGQFSAAAHGLPAGKLLLRLRRGCGHQYPEPVLEVAARAVFV